MQEQTIIGIDDKIQKLITGYTSLKKKYAAVVEEKDKLLQANLVFQESQSEKSGKFAEIETAFNKQKEEIEFLRTENANLREKVQMYENKMKEASDKIDNIFNQINEL